MDFRSLASAKQILKAIIQIPFLFRQQVAGLRSAAYIIFQPAQYRHLKEGSYEWRADEHQCIADESDYDIEIECGRIVLVRDFRLTDECIGESAVYEGVGNRHEDSQHSYCTEIGRCEQPRKKQPEQKIDYLRRKFFNRRPLYS